MGLVFVDVEAWGGAPCVGAMTEFGAVDYKSRQTFHGQLVKTKPDPTNSAIPLPTQKASPETYTEVFTKFAAWLKEISKSRPVFVSDNVAFDWQWINDGFFRTLGHNPFGHSGRRISDFYAGLTGDFSNTQKWKRLRITRHDHNPVHDALGNVEAFERILKGER